MSAGTSPKVQLRRDGGSVNPEHVRVLFDRLDLDMTGALDTRQATQLLSNIGLTELDDLKCAAAFKEMDRNSDGEVSFEEFMVYLNSCPWPDELPSTTDIATPEGDLDHNALGRALAARIQASTVQSETSIANISSGSMDSADYSMDPMLSQQPVLLPQHVHAPGAAVVELLQLPELDHMSDKLELALEALLDATKPQLQSYYDLLESHRPAECLKALTSIFGLSATVNSRVMKQLGSMSELRDLEGEQMSFESFFECACAIKLGALLTVYGEGGGTLTCCDFNPTKFVQTNIEPHDRRAWMEEATPPWVSNRWIHVQELEGQDEDAAYHALRLLGMKYGLHPLAIESATDRLGKRRPKCQPFDSHLFLLFPAVTVSRSTSAARNTLLSTSMVAIFLSTPRADTLISFVEKCDGQQKPAAFDQVWSTLKHKYDIPRSGDAILLLWKLLDALIDMFDPAADVLEAETADCLAVMRGPQGTSIAASAVHQRRVHDVQSDVKSLYQTMIPLPRVIDRLRDHLERQNHAPAQTVALLRDLEDRVQSDLFRLKFLEHESQSLSTEVQRAIDTRTNNVLYTLTVVSALFVPGNFFAAIWGMNFDHMPCVPFSNALSTSTCSVRFADLRCCGVCRELEWENGYLYFWCLLLSVWLVGGLSFLLYVRGCCCCCCSSSSSVK
jgi:magnesium transporter